MVLYEKLDNIINTLSKDGNLELKVKNDDYISDRNVSGINKIKQQLTHRFPNRKNCKC